MLPIWVVVLATFSAVVAVLSAVVTATYAVRARPIHELSGRLQELESQLATLTDYTTRRDTRERVRKMRDGRAAKEAAEMNSEPVPGTPEYKLWLRRKAMNVQ